MSEPARLNLDNQVFFSSTPKKRPISRRPIRPSRRHYDNQFVRSSPLKQPKKIYLAPHSKDVHLSQNTHKPKSRHRYSIKQVALMCLAVIVLSIGIFISIQTEQINHKASSQVAALSKKADAQGSGVIPSVTKPSGISSYMVAPDLPRYITIAKLHVFARVLQVGVTPSGDLGTPANVYDAAWYTGSAKPGQNGATLIDGHVSSWTTRGVFYGLNKLMPGDIISITKGNNEKINYKVVKSVTYPYNNVDMSAALTPIDPDKSGLNLITCTGQVIKGTNSYSNRIVVFASEVN